MAASLSTRRFLSQIVSRSRLLAHPSLSRFSTSSVPPQVPPINPPPQPAVPIDPPPPLPRDFSPSSSHETKEHESRDEFKSRERIKGKKVGGDYEEEQAKVLRASLFHVPRLGWSESAMIAGARDTGVSPSIIGSFPRKEAALVEFFMDECLERLIDKVESEEIEQLKNLIMSERISKLIQTRLRMQVPFLSKWPQALSIQSQPMNISTSLKQRAMLVDEIWHMAGDNGSDVDWYVKRTLLGAIYSASEIYMLSDNSPEFRDTWEFVDRRVKDSFDLQKTFQEAGYLAEAMGAGMGGSMQGILNRVFQR